MKINPFSVGDKSLKQPSKGVVCVGSVMLDRIGTITPTDKVEFRSLLGAKLATDGPIIKEVGGGASNVATSLKRLGYSAMPLARIADDYDGRWIRNRLIKEGIDLSMLQEHRIPYPPSLKYRVLAAGETFLRKVSEWIEKVTGYNLPVLVLVSDKVPRDYPLITGQSTILNITGKDRTVLTWRGVSNKLKVDEVNWQALGNAHGLYISNFGSENENFLEELVLKGKRLNPNVSIAFNPGRGQIEKGLNGLASALPHIDILTVNLQEAQILTGLGESAPVNVLLQTLKKAGPKVIVITDGKAGAYAYDGKDRYHMPSFKVEVKSTLGAGDAFGSTFMAHYMEKPEDLGKALVAASANAASVVTQVGAHIGLKTRKELEAWVQELQSAQPDIQVAKESLPLDQLPSAA